MKGEKFRSTLPIVVIREYTIYEVLDKHRLGRSPLSNKLLTKTLVIHLLDMQQPGTSTTNTQWRAFNIIRSTI